MTSIPMTEDGLKEQYEYYQRVEDGLRENVAIARRLLAEACRDRKAAYRKWQKKLKAAGLRL